MKSAVQHLNTCYSFGIKRMFFLFSTCGQLLWEISNIKGIGTKIEQIFSTRFAIRLTYKFTT